MRTSMPLIVVRPRSVVKPGGGSNAVGVQSGEYVHVTGIDRERNLLTVERGNGQQLTYGPHRLHGVSVYREAQRDFSAGDRVLVCEDSAGVM